LQSWKDFQRILKPTAIWLKNFSKQGKACCIQRCWVMLSLFDIGNSLEPLQVVSGTWDHHAIRLIPACTRDSQALKNKPHYSGHSSLLTSVDDKKEGEFCT